VEERKMAGAWEGEGGERLNKVEQPHGQPKKKDWKAKRSTGIRGKE
jgi:hypothetical protein